MSGQKIRSRLSKEIRRSTVTRRNAKLGLIWKSVDQESAWIRTCAKRKAKAAKHRPVLYGPKTGGKPGPALARQGPLVQPWRGAGSSPGPALARRRLVFLCFFFWPGRRNRGMNSITAVIPVKLCADSRIFGLNRCKNEQNSIYIVRC